MVLHCTDADGCKGGVIQWAFDYVTVNDGINTALVYPYVGKASMCRPLVQITGNTGGNLCVLCDFRMGITGDTANIILLANVNSRSRSLYVIVRPSVCLSVVCL